MNNKKIIWVIAVLVVIIVAVILFTSSDAPVQEPADTTSPNTEEQMAIKELPENVDDLAVSQPDVVLPAPPDEESASDVNIYRIAIVDGVITPEQIVLEQGSPAQIEVSVEGSDYDISIKGLNVYIPLKAGNSTAFDINQTAQKGVYTLTCQDTCGDSESSLSLIIK